MVGVSGLKSHLQPKWFCGSLDHQFNSPRPRLCCPLNTGGVCSQARPSIPNPCTNTDLFSLGRRRLGRAHSGAVAALSRFPSRGQGGLTCDGDPGSQRALVLQDQLLLKCRHQMKGLGWCHVLCAAVFLGLTRDPEGLDPGSAAPLRWHRHSSCGYVVWRDTACRGFSLGK